MYSANGGMKMKKGANPYAPNKRKAWILVYSSEKKKKKENTTNNLK